MDNQMPAAVLGPLSTAPLPLPCCSASAHGPSSTESSLGARHGFLDDWHLSRAGGETSSERVWDWTEERWHTCRPGVGSSAAIESQLSPVAPDLTVWH